MDLRFSVLASDRDFARAMRRIRPRFAPLVEAFAKMELLNPIHQAILVGITDTEKTDFFEEVPNRDGYFQVLAGVRVTDSDWDLAKQVLDILRRAATVCPFSKPDHEKIQRVFDAAEGKIAG